MKILIFNKDEEESFIWCQWECRLSRVWLFAIKLNERLHDIQSKNFMPKHTFQRNLPAWIRRQIQESS